MILWTNRTGEPLNAAIELCKKNGLEFDAVNDNVQKVKNDFNTYSRKITADIYIDDKALRIEYKPKKMKYKWPKWCGECADCDECEYSYPDGCRIADNRRAMDYQILNKKGKFSRWKTRMKKLLKKLKS